MIEKEETVSAYDFLAQKMLPAEVAPIYYASFHVSMTAMHLCLNTENYLNGCLSANLGFKKLCHWTTYLC